MYEYMGCLYDIELIQVLEKNKRGSIQFSVFNSGSSLRGLVLKQSHKE